MINQFCYIAFHPFLTVHVTKDTGKIPEVIGRLPGWKARIIRFNNDGINHSDQTGPGVEIITQKPIRIWKVDINLVWYLIKQAPNIDVLLLYHFDLNTFFYGLCYKILNRNGFLWNKLDLNEDVICDFPKIMKIRKPINRYIYQNLVRVFLKTVDLISSESTGNITLFQGQFPEIAGKLIYLPNGVDTATLPLIENVTREQFILTVARLGIWEKGTDILLEAYARSNIWPGWRLILIGNVDERFRTWIRDFEKKYPDVCNSIQWINHIDSREELARWYEKAMVFCFPSRVESFAIALVEAGYYGCACISSDFASAYDILDNGNCGLIFPRGKIDDLVNQLEKLCHDQEHIRLIGIRAQERIRSNFIYENIIKKWYEEYETRKENN